MKKKWKEPRLELLDIRETMLGSWKGGHDAIFDFNDKGWYPDNPGGGGNDGGGGNIGS
ncbi:paeninodin family lasso peptide [Virgibacillus doumboii]|uniref:paeninodin family lasso peptide n=1 Tax=Virgibacillus doumboii TaxID=2697503 RepID=UPI0013E06348|nr:paeninodin family lasso peptide [Virgibacillus doumboii]